MNPIEADLTESQQTELQSSSLFNDDLAPVPAARRKWRVGSFAALWISMSACIPTYMLASSLIGGGMNWWQAVLTIFLGNLIVLVPMVLNAHAGTKYGIPFPVYCRASFGTLGANVPAILRALVACGWFGIQAWIGGDAERNHRGDQNGVTIETRQHVHGIPQRFSENDRGGGRDGHTDE